MTMNLPDGTKAFLEQAGWGAAKVDPLPGDASFRRYFRVSMSGKNAMLMHAPAPHEDPQPFLKAAKWLAGEGHRSPGILAEDIAQGFVLQEDFGNYRMRDWLDDNPHAEERAYREALNALLKLRQSPAGPFAPYDIDTYLREVMLFPEWYCASIGQKVDEAGFVAAWKAALASLSDGHHPVTVLRDYHAENIMLLNPQEDGGTEQGLIDFQDALVGNPAYDLVSLLQDARRDVSPELERAMIDYYLARSGDDKSVFEADYALLGAQRNTKIVGIFARLCKRDGKTRYLGMIPRVWDALERDLAHPALQPVAEWFDLSIPRKIRDNSGGDLM
ncbi:aminoglycoside phosphotransferase family protein [Altericroceibacterium endophyticum]|uniref:Phosphotransferase n=1 Tax=Altericroceibacterium endophyticum TaxID=1808508 RepID=A0A6I4T3T9_9SPHN|nr:phosphotransferase [Altericroceibacterium endophyticum]MXO64733.1 phosphotransferase [Altericroceibacterium endophyticum]